MKKIIRNILSAAIGILVFAACISGFDQKEANELLRTENLTTEQYDRLLDLYDEGMDDAIEAAGKKDDEISQQLRDEMLTIFAIGMRLSKDETKLPEYQKSEFERINKKGTDNL